MALEIVAIDHLVLTVRRAEETAAFYERVLGMRQRTSPEGRVSLHFGPHKINLHELGRELSPRATRPVPGAADLCLVIADLGGALAHLREMGVDVVEGPVDREGAHGPISSIYIRDPDGNLIELAAYHAEDGGTTPWPAGPELLTRAEMAAAEGLAIEQGTPGLTLMERAGEAVARHALAMLGLGALTCGAGKGGSGHDKGDNGDNGEGRTNTNKGAKARRIVVLAGPGNNGGDGFVAACRLAEAEACEVVVALVGSLKELEGDARSAAELWSGETVEASPGAFTGADLIIDGLFGTGLKRPIEGALAALVAAINEAPAKVLAIDIASGIDADSGQVLGTAIKGDATVTFVRRKPGHLLLPGRLHSGVVHVADIGIGDDLLGEIAPKCAANGPALWGAHLVWPAPGGHKYDRGATLVVAGGIEFAGAARLAARAALRAGSGLATIAAPAEALAAHARDPAAIILREAKDADELAKLLEDKRFNAVVVGPGAGVGEDTRKLVLAALDSGAAVVIDADGITSFARHFDALAEAIAAKPERPVVLTPHEGEFARLFRASHLYPELSLDAPMPKEVIADRASKLARARRAAKASGAIVVFKGADTVIAAPDGRAAINENAPAWLATAGAGDVLAGLIAGLLAQGMGGYAAAAAATWLHGEAAQKAGPGLIADDLPERLPAVLRHLYQRHDLCQQQNDLCQEQQKWGKPAQAPKE